MPRTTCSTEVRSGLLPLFLIPALLAPACAQQEEPPMPMPPVVETPACKPQGPVRKAVVDQFTMPTTGEPCSVDLDGDGKADNALIAVIGTLKALSFDLQRSADALVKTGELLQLVSLQTEDAFAASCASVTLQKGQRPAMPPVLDGSDKLQVDAAQPASVLLGKIAGGILTTPLPAEQKPEQVAKLELALPSGFGGNLPLPLQGVHISGLSRKDGLVRGELHGTVKAEDVQARTVPAIAQALTTFIQQQPNNPATQQLVKTFETKEKCDKSPMLCCRTSPTTCQITADEVRDNGLVQVLLQPDVQMYSEGRWAPVPRGSARDSVSIGLCFTAVGAEY